MGSSPDYSIIAAPRVTVPTFAGILQRAGSPAAAEATSCYRAIADAGVDPTVALAVFRKESTFGRYGYAARNRSWGNIRGAPALNGGGFRTYSSWTAGAADVGRLLALYGRNQIRPGTRTDSVQTMPYVWAPSSDGNAPDAYGDALASWIHEWSGAAGVSGGTGGTGGTGTDATLASYVTAPGVLEAFLATIQRQLTDPVRDQDVIPFVQFLVDRGIVPRGGVDNPLVGAVVTAVRAHVGQPWNTLGGSLQQAAGNQDPFGLNAALGGLVAGLGDVLIHLVILVGILALIAMGAWLVATSED